MSDLIIKIGGDADDFNAALSDVKSKTESLEGQLATIATVSAVAFAGLTAEVYSSVKAFSVEQKAMGEINLVLQNQGIYTAELSKRYRDVAEELERKTGIDGDAITSGQALAQGFLGQTQITDDLTKAVVDLSVAKKQDLGSAFEIVSKAIAGNSMALKKLGIDIDDNKTKEEKMAEIVLKVNQRFGGQAEEAAKAGGGIKLLESAAGNLQKEFGSRLEPILSKVVGGLTSMINSIKDNKPLLDFITSVGVAGLVVSGLVAGLATAFIAFTKIRAVILAAKVATEAMGIAVTGLTAATGIGLLLIVVTELYLNWSSIWPRMQAVFVAFVNNIKNLAGNIGLILVGAFTFNLTVLKAGLQGVKDTLAKGFQEYGEVVKQKIADDKKSDVVQIESKKELGDKLAALDAANIARKKAVFDAEKALVVAETGQQSKAIIDLKKQELEILKQIEDEKNTSLRGILYKRLEETKILEKDAIDQDKIQKQTYRDEILAGTEEYNALTLEQQNIFNLTQKNSLTQTIQTEEQIRMAAAQKKLQDKIKTNAEFLENERKYGKSYADLQKFIQSEQVKGATSAAGELSALQGSSNSTLFAIGKDAAIANVSVKTAESAMNIYAGFSTIPFIGPALGVAGAAAAVAFGGEQLAKIASTPKPVRAAMGGLITGGTAGKDSVPAMLMPGELVVPTKNYEEVISAVSGARGGDGGSSKIEIILKLQDNLMDFIDAKLTERLSLGVSVQGV